MFIFIFQHPSFNTKLKKINPCFISKYFTQLQGLQASTKQFFFKWHRQFYSAISFIHGGARQVSWFAKDHTLSFEEPGWKLDHSLIQGQSTRDRLPVYSTLRNFRICFMDLLLWKIIFCKYSWYNSKRKCCYAISAKIYKHF